MLVGVDLHFLTKILNFVFIISVYFRTRTPIQSHRREETPAILVFAQSGNLKGNNFYSVSKTKPMYPLLLSAADLGMFGMFGRTGAPQKGAPQKERQIFRMHAENNGRHQRGRVK